MEATLKAAQATAEDTQRTLERRRNLLDRGYAPQAEFDAAKTAADVAAARAREILANLAVAKPARPHRRNRSRQGQGCAGARRRGTPPNGGSASGLSSPSAPAMSPISSAASATSPARQRRSSPYLPDGAIKLKIYVPEARSRRPRPRPKGRGALRRLPAGPVRRHRLYRARARIHPAGDLFAGEPPDACLFDRGARRPRQAAATAARPDRRRRAPDAVNAVDVRGLTKRFGEPRRRRRRRAESRRKARSSASSVPTVRARPPPSA